MMAQNLVGKTLDQYRLIAAIDSGGMATVYKAITAGGQGTVAVKVLHEQLARYEPKFVKRFRREAREATRLKHPHIVPIYDYGEHDGIPYMVMEYVGGGTLKDLMRRAPLTLEQTVTLVGQIASALTYAHDRHIFHRDVKPSNVLMAAPDHAKLSDFGIAKHMSDDSSTLLTALTGTGLAVGTVAYMAPEQARTPAEADTRADIYALGVMLYEMLTGKRPYDAETPAALAAQHLYEPVPSLRAHAPDLPEAYEQIVIKAMAKSPEERFQTAGELAATLAAAYAGEAITLNVVVPPLDPELTVEERVAPTAPTVVELDTSAGYDTLQPQHVDIFEMALAAYHEGQTTTARRIVTQILAEDDHAAEAWLLLSYIEVNIYDQLQCAENALAVAPNMEDARLRYEQLEAERLPATFGRTHSLIPAVQEVHDEAMQAYFAESMLEQAVGDPLDNPFQCPYCGVVNDEKRASCKHCGNNLMRTLPPQKASTPGLRLAQFVNFGVVVTLILQVAPATVWGWYQQLPPDSRYAWMVPGMAQEQVSWLFAGWFMDYMTEFMFYFLVGLGVLRLALMLLLALGLRFRLRWGYYLGLGLFGFEVIWGVFGLVIGWIGPATGLISVIVAALGIWGLSTGSANFSVSKERIRVWPERRLKSGRAYWDRGREYQKRGMWAMAVAQYRAAVANAPDRARYYKSLGIGYNKLNRPERARKAFEQAARLDPADLETMTLLKKLKE